MVKMKTFTAVILLLLLVFSCTKSGSTPTEPGSTTDEQAIRNLLNNVYMTLLTDASHYGEGDTTGGDFTPFSPVNPIHWYREPLGAIQKDIIIQIIDDTAYVSVTFTGTGDMHIFYFEGYQIDSIIKNFSDQFTRQAMFVREESANASYNGWRLRGIKPAEIHTTGGNHHIDSVVIATGDTTYHIDNFDNYYLIQNDSLNGLMTLEPGDTIGLTLYTHGDSADAFLHIGWKYYHRRSYLDPVSGQPGVFSRSDIVLESTMPDHVHFAFDIIDYSTLHTTDGAYYSAAYIIPFNVTYPDFW